MKIPLIKNNSKGFTLVEVLVTTIIFAILASITYSTINSSLKSQVIQKKHSEILTQLHNTLNFSQRDLNQIFEQNINLNVDGFKFTSLQNNKLLKLQYLLEDNKLIRLDISNEQNIVKTTLIDDVEKINIRLLDDKNKWLNKWQKNKDNTIKAIEIKFEHSSLGKIIKLIDLK